MLAAVPDGSPRTTSLKNTYTENPAGTPLITYNVPAILALARGDAATIRSATAVLALQGKTHPLRPRKELLPLALAGGRGEAEKSPHAFPESLPLLGGHALPALGHATAIPRAV